MPTAVRAEPPRRASALPPAERRAAIVAAALPLLLERGTSITTRQIAEAAGVAEGTIFRVFADKDEVVAAVVEAAFDPTPTEAAIEAVDASLPFEAQLAAAVEALQRRTGEIWRLLATVGEAAVRAPKAPPPDSPALARLLARHRDRLRAEPAIAARQLRSLTVAFTHPAIHPGGPLPADEVVALALDGLRAR